MSTTVHIQVGVVVERRKALSAWVDYIWQPVKVLVGAPQAEPWTLLEENADTASFYAGGTSIELYSVDAGLYHDNLVTGEPLLWVVLRAATGAWPYELFKVTADPHEGVALTESGTDLIETVPMPDVITAEIADFVALHHVDRSFVKRKRNRANLEAFARRIPGGEGKS